MGIGSLYKKVLKEIGADVTTVDSDIAKGADLPSIEPAILAHAPFDTVHICTPNFTHESIARKIAPHAKIVFIEKPGLKDGQAWRQLVKDFPDTKFMMVKNGQWRTDAKPIIAISRGSGEVYITWINKNRVPNPGSWFTNKELAFGGVSRDLMPHLLSYVQAIETRKYISAKIVSKETKQNWTLEELADTDYGTVNKDGVYDVDDYCKIELDVDRRKFILIANWRSNSDENIAITAKMPYQKDEVFPLGLCPEEAYKAMIEDAVKNLDNPNFWIRQYEYDCWIHDILGKL